MNFFRAISNLLRFDRTNWKALALCLFAATVFWIFNALNKNYATNIRFPLQFEFDNTRYVAVDPLPATITLNVSGNGWELFRKSFGLKAPSIQMPLERPTEVRKIVASTLSPVVASQIGGLQVNFIVTDTLRLRIESKATRKIKLIPDLKAVSYKRNFGRVSPLVVVPDSVTLEGPKSIIEHLSDSILLTVNASKLSDNYRESIEVPVSNNDLINRNPPVAEVMFEVGQIEEISRTVKLRIAKVPWGVEVDHDSVTCVFLVPQKELTKFAEDAHKILASFTLMEIAKGETRSFRPILKGVPSYAELMFVDSVRVKKY